VKIFSKIDKNLIKKNSKKQLLQTFRKKNHIAIYFIFCKLNSRNLDFDDKIICVGRAGFGILKCQDNWLQCSRKEGQILNQEYFVLSKC
jgi:hypothetical protein